MQSNTASPSRRHLREKGTSWGRRGRSPERPDKRWITHPIRTCLDRVLLSWQRRPDCVEVSWPRKVFTSHDGDVKPFEKTWKVWRQAIGRDEVSGKWVFFCKHNKSFAVCTMNAVWIKKWISKNQNRILINYLLFSHFGKNINGLVCPLFQHVFDHFEGGVLFPWQLCYTLLVPALFMSMSDVVYVLSRMSSNDKCPRS